MVVALLWLMYEHISALSSSSNAQTEEMSETLWKIQDRNSVQH